MIFSLTIASVLVAAAFAGCKDPTYQHHFGEPACFKLYERELSFADAQAVCKGDGGDMASVHNSYEFQSIDYLLSKNESAVIGLQCSRRGKCRWTDGTRYNIEAFFIDEPVVEHGNCIEHSKFDGRWYATSCEHLTAFICRLQDDSQGPACGDYTPYKGYCIKEGLYGWPDTAEIAEADCASDGGHLLSIHSEEENTFIKNFFISKGINETAYIGLQSTYFGDYQWKDGSNVGYTNWAQFFPNNRIGDCVLMAISSDNEFGNAGEWFSGQCEQRNPYICRREEGISQMLAPMACPKIQIFNDEGVIYSPGFPMWFAPNSTCEYLITAKIGSQVEVRFPYYRTDDNTTLTLYEGIYDKRPIQIFAGESSFWPIKSKGNVLKIVFQTSAAPVGDGWVARFTSTGYVPTTTPSARATSAPSIRSVAPVMSSAVPAGGPTTAPAIQTTKVSEIKSTPPEKASAVPLPATTPKSNHSNMRMGISIVVFTALAYLTAILS